VYNVFVVFMIDVKNLRRVGKVNDNREMKRRTKKDEAKKMNTITLTETLAISDGMRWINTKQGTA
jgi:hypothetical protein